MRVQKSRYYVGEFCVTDGADYIGHTFQKASPRRPFGRLVGRSVGFASRWTSRYVSTSVAWSVDVLVGCLSLGRDPSHQPLLIFQTKQNHYAIYVDTRLCEWIACLIWRHYTREYEPRRLCEPQNTENEV
jgi:hypothetical protein